MRYNSFSFDNPVRYLFFCKNGHELFLLVIGAMNAQLFAFKRFHPAICLFPLFGAIAVKYDFSTLATLNLIMIFFYIHYRRASRSFLCTHLLLFLFFFFTFSLPAPALATIYTFVDDNGISHFSNVPTDPRYKPMNSGRSKSNLEHYFDPLIESAGKLYKIDPLLIKAIIKQESNFNRHAQSKKGAMGLMQLMPSTATDMNVTDVFDPQENIFGGTRYLQWLSKVFDGDIKLILASYNAGPDRVKSAKTIPDIQETKHYVRSVLDNYRYYKNLH